MTQVIQTPEQQYYLAKLLGYDYEIQYKSSSSNIVDDSLSRVDKPTEAHRVNSDNHCRTVPFSMKSWRNYWPIQTPTLDTSCLMV